MASAQHHDEHMKRVSFGPEDDVKLFVYEDGYANSTPANFQIRRSTSPPLDNTLNKVRVTSEEAEFPRPISPPAQLEELPVQAISPPLPSLVRRMEHEADNPFRPEDSLYHEVDPIVKAYSKRPFPPSPTGSPIPPADLTPIKNGRHVTLDNSSVTIIDGPPRRASSQSPNHNATVTTFDTSTPQKQNLLRQQGNGAHDNNLPPPKHDAEIVHLDGKKKKCACCSIQ